MADPNEIPPPPPDPTLYFPQQAQAQQPQQLSTLDLLRKRMASELENEQAQRMSDLGNALLASRSRSLFGALGEGFRAQDEGARARMDRLRQLAETERQERALESQEAARRDQARYQQGSLALRQLEAERAGRPQFQVIGQDAQGNAIVMDPRNPSQTVTLQGVTPTQALRNQPRVLSQADIARISQAATTRANTDVGILPGIMPTPAQIARRDELQQRYLADALEAARQGVSGPQGGTPAAPAGQPAPSSVLRYSGPQPAPTQQ